MAEIMRRGKWDRCPPPYGAPGADLARYGPSAASPGGGTWQRSHRPPSPPPRAQPRRDHPIRNLSRPLPGGGAPARRQERHAREEEHQRERHHSWSDRRWEPPQPNVRRSEDGGQEHWHRQPQLPPLLPPPQQHDSPSRPHLDVPYGPSSPVQRPAPVLASQAFVGSVTPDAALADDASISKDSSAASADAPSSSRGAVHAAASSEAVEKWMRRARMWEDRAGVFERMYEKERERCALLEGRLGSCSCGASSLKNGRSDATVAPRDAGRADGWKEGEGSGISGREGEERGGGRSCEGESTAEATGRDVNLSSLGACSGIGDSKRNKAEKVAENTPASALVGLESSAAEKTAARMDQANASKSISPPAALAFTAKASLPLKNEERLQNATAEGGRETDCVEIDDYGSSGGNESMDVEEELGKAGECPGKTDDVVDPEINNDDLSITAEEEDKLLTEVARSLAEENKRRNQLARSTTTEATTPLAQARSAPSVPPPAPSTEGARCDDIAPPPPPQSPLKASITAKRAVSSSQGSAVKCERERDDNESNNGDNATSPGVPDNEGCKEKHQVPSELPPEEENEEKKRCAGCDEMKSRADFTSEQWWRKEEGRRRCAACKEKKKKEKKKGKEEKKRKCHRCYEKTTTPFVERDHGTYREVLCIACVAKEAQEGDGKGEASVVKVESVASNSIECGALHLPGVTPEDADGVDAPSTSTPEAKGGRPTDAAISCTPSSVTLGKDDDDAGVLPPAADDRAMKKNSGLNPPLTKRCTGCERSKAKADFPIKEWKKGEGKKRRLCAECKEKKSENKKDSNKRKRCPECGKKMHESFMANGNGGDPVCPACAKGGQEEEEGSGEGEEPSSSSGMRTAEGESIYDMPSARSASDHANNGSEELSRKRRKAEQSSHHHYDAPALAIALPAVTGSAGNEVLTAPEELLFKRCDACAKAKCKEDFSGPMWIRGGLSKVLGSAKFWGKNLSDMEWRRLSRRCKTCVEHEKDAEETSREEMVASDDRQELEKVLVCIRDAISSSKNKKDRKWVSLKQVSQVVRTHDLSPKAFGYQGFLTLVRDFPDWFETKERKVGSWFVRNV